VLREGPTDRDHTLRCDRRYPEKYFQQDGHRHWVFTGTLFDQKGLPHTHLPAPPISIWVSMGVGVHPTFPAPPISLGESMGVSVPLANRPETRRDVSLNLQPPAWGSVEPKHRREIRTVPD
jgi:hypothetical protein